MSKYFNISGGTILLDNIRLVSLKETSFLGLWKRYVIYINYNGGANTTINYKDQTNALKDLDSLKEALGKE